MNLRTYLTKQHIMPSQFGRLIGVSRYAVYRWLDGSRTPNGKSLQLIRDATGGAVTPNDFFPDPPGEAA